MAQVVVEMTAEEAKLWRAQQKILAQTKELEKGYTRVSNSAKKTERSGVRAGTRQKSAFSSLGRSLTGLVTGYASINTAVNLYNQYLEKQNQLSQKSLDITKDLAVEQQEALKNMSALSDEEVRDVHRKQSVEIQAATGFPSRTALTRAISQGYGTGGNTKEIMNAVSAAARINMLTPQNVSILTEGALDVSKAIGSAKAEENIGFLLTAAAINRIGDQTKLAKQLGGTLKGGVLTVPGQAKKEAAEDIGAVFGVLAKATVDPEGATTKSFTTKLLGRLRTFYKDRPDDPGTILGRIKALQSDQALRAKFLETPFGEENFRLPLEAMLTPGSEIAKDLAASRKDVTFDPQVYKNLIKRQRVTPELVIAQASARVKALEELATPVEDGVTKVMQELYELVLDRTGKTDFTSRWKDTIEKGVFRQYVLSGAIDPVRFTKRKFGIFRRRFQEQAREGEITSAQADKWIETIDRAVEHINAMADALKDANQVSTLNANRKRQAQHGGAVEAQ